MEPIKIAAHFAAFACYLNRETGRSLSPREAGKYARANWKRYVPYVDENLGKFLTEPPKSQRVHPSSSWAKN
jgi:hypothetical protein